MISVHDAERSLAAHQIELPTEEVALDDAVGRVLRQQVAADRDLPPYDRVAMDGIAVWAGGSREWRVAGTALAGQPQQQIGDPATECMQVATGGVLPVGCDAVVRIEDVDIADGVARLAADVAIEPGQNIHKRGVDAVSGTTVLGSGVRIGPTEVATLASVGCPRVAVATLPKVAVVSTGDELVEVAAEVAPHQIRRSNPDTVLAALRQRGIDAGAEVLPDDPDRLRRAVAAALERSDVVITTGAVSMGTADHLPRVLADNGVDCYFHRVAQRPGKPLWVGGSAAGKRVFALPGNPVSVVACLYRYVLPFLDRASGLASRRELSARLAETFPFAPALALFLPVRLSTEDGQLLAHPAPTGGSGDFLSLVGTDGIACFDGDADVAADHFAAGTSVRVIPWQGPPWH